jgi:hypothetical protein
VSNANVFPIHYRLLINVREEHCGKPTSVCDSVNEKSQGQTLIQRGKKRGRASRGREAKATTKGKLGGIPDDRLAVIIIGKDNSTHKP